MSKYSKLMKSVKNCKEKKLRLLIVEKDFSLILDFTNNTLNYEEDKDNRRYIQELYTIEYLKEGNK